MKLELACNCSTLVTVRVRPEMPSRLACPACNKTLSDARYQALREAAIREVKTK